jgi:N-acetylmuramoyl-L-alanine amidase
MKLMAALVVAVPLLAAPADAQVHAVTAVRHWSVGEVTRVAVEVTGPFEIRSDRLHNPERVYFDIHNARPQFEGHRRFLSEDINEKLLKKVRVAETQPDVTRVVLELDDNVEATPSQLTNPNRLMIELRLMPAPATPPVISQALPATPALVNQPVVAPPIVPPAPAPQPARPAAANAAKPLISDVVALAHAPTAVPLPPVAADVKPTEAVAVAVAAVASNQTAPTSPPPSELAKSARHTSTGESSLTRALGLKINRVVIDPGHGGHDQGTTGPKGLLEKDLVLDVALRVGKLIQDRMGAEVIYTRTDDTFVPLEGRTALANEKKADLFLSIHANSSPASHVSGIETYYLNFTDSKDALDVAARENASSQKSVFELRDLIQKITLHDKLEESREFANRIQSSLYAFSLRNFPGEKNRGVRKAPFVVLIGADMPSVLAEIGFLSNPKEEALLKKSDYRQKLAEALYRGIARYAESLSHFQMAQN